MIMEIDEINEIDEMMPFEMPQVKNLPTTWGIDHSIKNPFLLCPHEEFQGVKRDSLENTYSDSLDDDYLYQELNNELLVSFQIIHWLRKIKHTYSLEIEKHSISVPQSSKKILAFDLDETLIHSVSYNEYLNLSPSKKSKWEFININDDENSIVPFCIRPYAEEFLSVMSCYFNIIVFCYYILDIFCRNERICKEYSVHFGSIQ